MRNKIILSLFLILIIFSNLFSQTERVPQLLSKDLKEGEALIWYLHHSGWAIKTRSHFLIFDYWENVKKPANPSLENGFLNAKEIQDLKTYVFISHAHSDHYDPIILNWQDSVNNIKYIFGWNALDDTTHHYFGTKREIRKIDDLEIINIHHSFDKIPESAFLIHVDGLSIYHAGDHGHSQSKNNQIFKNNVDYLAKVDRNIDIVFTPTFGGEYCTIESLSPRVVFPMHNGGYERQYKKFVKKVKNTGIEIEVAAAEKQGDCFYYSKGEMKKFK